MQVTSWPVDWIISSYDSPPKPLINPEKLRLTHLGKETTNIKEILRNKQRNDGSRINWKVEGRWKSAKALNKEITRKDEDELSERDYDVDYILMDALRNMTYRVWST